MRECWPTIQMTSFIPAKTKKELEERIIQFLKIAEKYNLCFKQSKFNLNVKKIPILGVVVGRGEVQMKNNKVKVVKEQKTSTKIKEVESFLEFANFYQCFIKNFSHMTKPLNELNGKKEQKWDDKKELEKDDRQAQENDSIVYVKGRIYVPNNQKMQEQILQENHESVDIGYSGQQRMLELIKRNYQWPGIRNDIKKYVQKYIKCQQNKVQHMKKAGELYSPETPEGP